MTRNCRHIALALLLTISAIGSSMLVAQRKVTPVEQKKSTIQTVEGKKAAKELLDKNIEPSLVFGDSIFEMPDEIAAREDTVKLPKNKYPRIYSLTFGVDLWDTLLRLFGQKYGITGFSAEMSFHNRYNAIAEIGLGYANYTPDGYNYTYKVPLSIYGKLGGSYNFLYNSDPDYRFTAGFVMGFSPFKYSLKNVSLGSDYWGESQVINVDGISSNALWGEIILGLRVKMVKNISMGWNFRYRFIFNSSKDIHGEPWYIPGFGPRTQRINGAFSVFYTLPLHKGVVYDIDSKTKAIVKSLNNGNDLGQ